MGAIMTEQASATPAAPGADDKNGFELNYVRILIGPALFFIALALPVFGDLQARGGFGILFWLGYWWISGAVPLTWTWVVPFLAATLVPEIAPIPVVIKAYAHKFVLLIAATLMIAAAWIRWGIAKRVALHFLVRTGNRVTTQVLAWFFLSLFISFVVADTITAVALAPIAGSLLYAVGYQNVEDRWKSTAATAVILAVAFGASHGGFGTPLGSGAALIALKEFQGYLGHDIEFLSWTVRMVPPLMLEALAIALYLRFALNYEISEFPGSKDHYRNELAKLGPPSRGELISFWGFVIGIVLVFGRPFFKAYVPFKIDPTAVFFMIACLMFLIRATKDEMVLNPKILHNHFPVVVIIIWPTAVALAEILKITGASAVVGTWMAPLASGAPEVALAGFTAIGGLITQFSTNSAAVAIVAPLAIDSIKAIGENALPWGMATALMAANGYAVVSATGGMAVCVAYGANIRSLFIHGMALAGVVWTVNYIYWYLVIFVFKPAFYMTM